MYKLLITYYYISSLTSRANSTDIIYYIAILHRCRYYNYIYMYIVNILCKWDSTRAPVNLLTKSIRVCVIIYGYSFDNNNIIYKNAYRVRWCIYTVVKKTKKKRTKGKLVFFVSTGWQVDRLLRFRVCAAMFYISVFILYVFFFIRSARFHFAVSRGRRDRFRVSEPQYSSYII